MDRGAYWVARRDLEKRWLHVLVGKSILLVVAGALVGIALGRDPESSLSDNPLVGKVIVGVIVFVGIFGTYELLGRALGWAVGLWDRRAPNERGGDQGEGRSQDSAKLHREDVS